jgi:hypothetical protein
VEVDVVERRPRRRHGLDVVASTVECREDGRDRPGSVRDARAHEPAVWRDLARSVETLYDLGRRHDIGDLGELEGHELSTEVRLQLLRTALDDDLAAADDRDALGEAVGLLEIVGREEDRQVLLLREPLDLYPHCCTRLRVQPGGRLVEEEHAWPVDEADRDVESTLHPTGVATRDPVGGFAETHELEQLVDARVQ